MNENEMDDMPTTSRSELTDVDFRSVGFTFIKHPTRKNFFLQVSVYKEINDERDKFIVCMSEGRGKGSVNNAKRGLGGVVPGRFVAPFAQRGFDGAPGTVSEVMKTFKEAFQESYPGAVWHWMEDENVPALPETV